MSRPIHNRFRRQGGGLKLWLAAGLVAFAILMLLGLTRWQSQPSESSDFNSSAPATQQAATMPAAAPLMTPAQSVQTSPQHRGIGVGQNHSATAMISPQTGPAVKAPGTAYVAAPQITPQPATGTSPVELLLDVHINQQPWHETTVMLGFGTTPNTGLYARGADLQNWRLRLPAASAYEYQGKKYYSLDAIPGLSYRVDSATQTLWISAPPADFTGTVVDGLFTQNPQPQHTPLGGFLNYDFLGTRVTGSNSVNGLFEAGLFNDWGVGTSSFLGQNLNQTGRQFIRLDTVWTHDNPDNMTTLQLGDSITDGGMTGLAVRMGGIQYGTNFSTQPYFVTFPLPALNGQAALPSTVQLYVNGVLKSTQQVPPGPFTVPAVPVVTGAGQAMMVVQDMLGNQQVINASFYATSTLLKAGLDDYSFSAGELRDNYGLESNDYGPFAATGVFRHGFSDDFTGELHGETSPGLEDASLGGTYATPALGALNGAVAASHSTLGSGVLGLIGLQQQWQTFSAGANVQFASPRFTELGYSGLPAPHKQIAANVGAFFGRNGSVSLAYLDQDSPLFGHVRLVTANYSVAALHNGFFAINAFHTLSGSSNNGVVVMFTLPFGERSNVSVGVQQQNNVDQAFAQVQESLPAGTGSGYRVSAEAGPDAVNQAEYDYQNSVGTYRVGAMNAAGQTSYQAEATGALAFIGGGVFPTRQITSSFGLVQVPGISNVTVYADNQPVAVTDKNGDALLPLLRPYENNPISLDAQSLPLSAQVNTLNANAVPRYRSGVVVKFPITSSRGATFTVKLPNGQPLPAGAMVHIVGQTQTFPTGLDGEVYLTGLATHNEVVASWDHQSCRLSVKMPESKNPLPDLGTFTCKLVSP
ncbi:MAG: fimbria/pilus outer membrane usher protein [Gammaproteobacteria bacterium]